MIDDLDPRSPIPLYEQIAARIRVAVAAQEYAEGDALPSVRQLAASLRVNPATVVQAYRDLEREGFVEMRHGAGTFVRAVPAEKRREEQARQSRALARAMLAEAARLGLPASELLRALTSEIGGSDA
ncbi:MAG TPA: GntR family transcriptional regulator [Longimicrobiales bacterium]